MDIAITVPRLLDHRIDSLKEEKEWVYILMNTLSLVVYVAGDPF